MKKEEFKVLSDREHVLTRSGMYIGSVVSEELSGIIDFKYQTKNISPGLIKLVEECYRRTYQNERRVRDEDRSCYRESSDRGHLGHYLR